MTQRALLLPAALALLLIGYALGRLVPAAPTPNPSPTKGGELDGGSPFLRREGGGGVRSVAAPPQGYGLAAGFDAAGAVPADLDRFGPLWYYDYRFRSPDDAPGHQRLLLIEARSAVSAGEIAALARTRPGHWWILGNEPNDPNQDNLAAPEYARWFVRTAAVIRAADPSAGILSAGIADADRIPAQAFIAATIAWSGASPDLDGWNIHNYLLDGPDPYDSARFQARILAFHDWMVGAGQAGKPLLLGEWGVLYGRGCCSRPLDLASRGLAYMDRTADWLESSGLVTAWAWFTLRSGDRQFNGDLLQPATPALSAFGDRYRVRAAAYAARPRR